MSEETVKEIESEETKKPAQTGRRKSKNLLFAAIALAVVAVAAVLIWAFSNSGNNQAGKPVREVLKLPKQPIKHLRDRLLRLNPTSSKTLILKSKRSANKSMRRKPEFWRTAPCRQTPTAKRP
jgi:hypothetical protein